MRTLSYPRTNEDMRWLNRMRGTKYEHAAIEHYFGFDPIRAYGSLDMFWDRNAMANGRKCGLRDVLRFAFWLGVALLVED